MTRLASAGCVHSWGLRGRDSRSNVTALLPLLRFARPHTIGATTVQVIGLYVITWSGLGSVAMAPLALLLALASGLAANLYVVGLNQISDVEIDQINKPRLPLAAGDLSLRQGWWITFTVGALAVVLAAAGGIYLLVTVLLALGVGTLYSLPPRLKRYAFWAALSIALVRGVVANVGFYWYFRQALGAAAGQFEPPLTWLTPFFFGFGLVIALYKDIPDREGDSRFTIQTFTTHWGAERVFAVGRLLLTALYLWPVGQGFLRWPAVDGVVMVFSHLGALVFFWYASRRIDPAGPEMPRFYLVLWGLFYGEYIFLVLQALLRG